MCPGRSGGFSTSGEVVVFAGVVTFVLTNPLSCPWPLGLSLNLSIPDFSISTDADSRIPANEVTLPPRSGSHFLPCSCKCILCQNPLPGQRPHPRSCYTCVRACAPQPSVPESAGSWMVRMLPRGAGAPDTSPAPRFFPWEVVSAEAGLQNPGFALSFPKCSMNAAPWRPCFPFEKSDEVLRSLGPQMWPIPPPPPLSLQLNKFAQQGLRARSLVFPGPGGFLARVDLFCCCCGL